MKVIEATGHVQDIDFLPDHFRERYAMRKVQMWRLTCVTLFLLGLPLASLNQYRIRLRIEGQINEVIPQYAQAQTDTDRLAEVQRSLSEIDSKAKLVTYLRHPWPKTQILAAITYPLPRSIKLEELTIRPDHSRASSRELQQNEKEQDDREVERHPPAKQDALSLRKTTGNLVVLNLAGTTTDSAELHRYLARLGRHPLISAVDLESIQAREARSTNGQEDRRPASQFSVRVEVRPGFGEPAGPTRQLTTSQSTSSTVESNTRNGEVAQR